MKNNKKTLWVLMPLMMIVWGLIAYQLFKTTNTAKNAASSEFTPKRISSHSDTVDFKLSLNYRDPFQSSQIKTEKPRLQNTRVSKVVQKKATVIAPIEWPDIKYGGTVRSSSSKEVALLSIDGNSYLVNKGDVVGDMVVLNYNKNEVRLRYSNQEKIIRK